MTYADLVAAKAVVAVAMNRAGVPVLVLAALTAHTDHVSGSCSRDQSYPIIKYVTWRLNAAGQCDSGEYFDFPQCETSEALAAMSWSLLSDALGSFCERVRIRDLLAGVPQ